MNSTQQKAVVVLSGGQDSTTCLFQAVAQFGRANVHCITFDYAQRHRREIQAAINVAKLMEVASHEVIQLGPILKGTSPLTDPDAKLELYESAEQMEATIGKRVELTFVPMRNALFLTIAANRAVVLGCQNIITGVCEADNANYPDCTESFIEGMQDAINEALGESPRQRRILTPLINLTKAESIRMMNNLGGIPYLAFTHTAYDGGYPPVSKDHANTLRAQGFELAGWPDPLVLRAVDEGLMPLPATMNYADAFRNITITETINRLKAPLAPEDLA